MTAPIWTRREWPDTGAVEYELETDSEWLACVAVNPESIAREDDWREYVPVGLEPPFCDVDLPCTVLAEALRARGWTCVAPSDDRKDKP